MPLSLTVWYGFRPTDLHASIRPLVMLLWPHPLQSVEAEPWKATVGSEKRRPGASIMMVASSRGMADHLGRLDCAIIRISNLQPDNPILGFRGRGRRSRSVAVGSLGRGREVVRAGLVGGLGAVGEAAVVVE